MKAAVYTEYGPPEVLHLREIATPIPKDHEVLVKIRAASVNAADWRLLMARPFLARLNNGLLRPGRQVLGSDVAGTVEAVGRNVKRFQPGDEVFGDLSSFGWGGFSEYVCAHEDAWVVKPSDVTFEQAAALPMAGTTALQGLRDIGMVQPGQQVLIHGASGGVGTFAVQIAKYLGGEVTAACSTSKVELARSLGADHVIDYTREDFTRSGRRYDLIFAPNGDRSILDYRRGLSPSGRYVFVGGSSGQIFQSLVLGAPVFLAGRKKMAIATAKSNHDDLALLVELLRAGRVKPVIDRHFPLSAVPEAIRYLAEGRARGKVIVTMDAIPT